MRDIENPLRLRVLSPHGTMLDVKAQSVRLSATDGSMGIRKGHPPAVIALTHGRLVYVADGQSHGVDIDGSFAHVKDDTVTVISK